MGFATCVSGIQEVWCCCPVWQKKWVWFLNPISKSIVVSRRTVLVQFLTVSMIWERKRPLFLSEFAHICYINIRLNGNGFPLRESSTRRSLHHKPFCVSFSKPHSCFQHLELRAKGGDRLWWWGKVVGNASQKYLVFWTAGWAGRRSEIKVPPRLPHEMCSRLVSLASASTSSLFQSQLAQPALLHMVCFPLVRHSGFLFLLPPALTLYTIFVLRNTLLILTCFFPPLKLPILQAHFPLAPYFLI